MMIPMRYFLDTEFIERGRQYPIELVSIGIVSEDERELYCISSEFNPDHANQWVRDNVLMKLGHYRCPPSTIEEIASAVQQFCDPELYGKPEFWGYYADYDWVVFCQMFGSMIDLPKGWPMYCNDIKQLSKQVGDPQLPQQGKSEHHALADARWNRMAFHYLLSIPSDCLVLHHPWR